MTFVRKFAWHEPRRGLKCNPKMAKAKSRICCDQDSVYDFFMKAKQDSDILIRKFEPSHYTQIFFKSKRQP